MSLVTPTVQDLTATIIAQLEVTLNQTIPLVPKAFIRVLAKVLAAVIVLLFKYGGFIFLQQFVKTASLEEVNINGQLISPLRLWGNLIGVGDPAAGVRAQLSITITVEDQSGSLDAGLQLTNTGNGVIYRLLVSVPLVAATVVGSIEAIGDQSGGDGVGTIGNLSDGDTVSFVNPIPKVNQNTIVASTTQTGSDDESEDAYRQRIVDRFQKRIQGGALVDFEVWGTEPADIINVYPYTGAIAGHVDVFSESNGPDPDGIPNASQLAAVSSSIEFDPDELPPTGLASRRPAGTFVNSFPITRSSFDVTVNGLVVDSPTTVQTTITAAVVEYFLEREPFVSGVTLLPRTDAITANDVTSLVNQIVTAAGGTFLSAAITETVSGVPVFNFTLGQGEKAKLNGGTVTFL